MKRSSQLSARQRLARIATLAALTIGASACEAEWFAPHRFQCEPWPKPDTSAKQPDFVTSHPDSTNCKRAA